VVFYFLGIHSGASASAFSGVRLLEIHGAEPNRPWKAVVPFEVIEQRPVEVSPHVRAARARAVEGREAPANERRAQAVGASAMPFSVT